MKITELKREYNYYNSMKGIRKLINSRKKKDVSIQVHAFEEGQRQEEVLIAKRMEGERSALEKNKYNAYEKIVEQLYKMYNSEADYGSEVLRGILDIRVSMISGKGLTIETMDNKPSTKRIKKYFDLVFADNKLYGSRFLDDVLISELEGKLLAIIEVEKTDERKKIFIDPVFWRERKYKVKMKNYHEIEVVTYKEENEEKEKVLKKIDELEYIKIGGTPDEDNDTVSRIGNVVTQIENISKALYDIRKNNHLFARVTPTIETKEERDAKQISEKINETDWTIGQALCMPAKFALNEPTGSGSDALVREITQLMKIISMLTGIPLMLMAYPELLSNRATADVMMESINAAIQKEKLRLEEFYTELLKKVLRIAVNEGIEEKLEYYPECFQIKIDSSTFVELQQIIDVWMPLLVESVISMKHFRTLVPGIDHEEMEKQVNEEKEENMARFEDMRGTMKGEEQEESKEDEENGKKNEIMVDK